MLVAALLPAAIVSAETPDKAQEFYSPEYAGAASFVTSYSSPQADSVNPAASALTQRLTLDLSYFALAGENGSVSGLKGSAFNAGATFPTKAGVLTFSGHYLDSEFPDFRTDTDFTLKSSFAKELYPGISTGLGLGFGLSGSGGVSAVMDIGIIQELGPRGFVKDLRWGTAFRNIGYTTIGGTYPEAFDVLVGTRALLVDSDSLDFALNTELGLPGFSNMRLGIGGELQIGSIITLTGGSRIDLNQLLDGDSSQLIPSVGIAFAFTTDISDESDFLGLSERGWNRSEIRSSFTVAPVMEDVWAFGGGLNIPLGVIDNKPPEITIDLDGIRQGEGDKSLEEEPADEQQNGTGNVSFRTPAKPVSFDKRSGLKVPVKETAVKGPVKGLAKQVMPVQQSDGEKGGASKTGKGVPDPRYPGNAVIAYMSPNNDGVKDEISVPIRIQDSRYITRFEFIVEASDGKLVRTIANKEKRVENEGFRGFFDRLFSVKSGIEIPSSIRWDGTDDDGSVLEDGVYYFYVQAYDDNGNRSASERFSIVLDNSPPAINLVQPEEDQKIFSPNDDGLKDSLTFEQSGSEEELWEGLIRDSSGEIVKTASWNWSEPETFVWDGTDNDGILLPDGVYSYRISSVDRAGNSVEESASNIVINTEVTPISLNIDRSHFSPDDDEVFDYIILTPDIPVTRGIRDWEMTIQNESGITVRSYKGMTEVPERIAFDGKDNNGITLVEGSYNGVLKVLYVNGNYPSTESAAFTIDVSEPEAMVRISDTVFSPDGDGNKDTITFYNETSLEDRWKGNVYLIDDDGKIAVRTWEWVEKAPAELVWNGISDEGRLAQDGRYTYQLAATDRAGNTGQSVERAFDLDTSKVEVIFSAEFNAFSPNGNGVKDRIGLSPKLQQRDGIDSYTVTVLNQAGRAVRTIRENGSPPEIIFWDGKDDSRRTVPDGMYKADLKLVYRNGSESKAETRSFELDTRVPEAQIAADYTLFSPDGDGRRDTVLIRQNGSEEELWSGSVVNADGEVIKRVFWKGLPGNYSWDGTSEAGNKVSDGIYSYRLTSEDAAGNSFKASIEGLKVDTAQTRIFVTADLKAFSPNGDGKFEEIAFSTIVNNKTGITDWKLELVMNDSSVQKRFSGDSRIPARIIWDGKNESGNYIEGNYRARFTVSYEKGNQPSAESSPFLLDRSAPEIAVEIHPQPFSPDNDGIDDELTFELMVKDASKIDSWQLTVFGPEGKVFKDYGGSGVPADRIIWDGKSDDGELVYAAMDYPYRFSATDILGNRASTDGIIPVDVLVVREGNLLKIKIASIIFKPNLAEFADEDPVVAERNRYVLDRLAEILQKYRNYQITVEGHAALINWADPVKAQREEREELQPLSEARARQVVDALTQRGIDAGRLTAIGVGGTKPLVPHSDIENRWKNRRVEFILEKKR
jgi:flagellar hook assembly protein FlgD/outer membrane protein OmpA-like peptidoglycan-associated protein